MPTAFDNTWEALLRPGAATTFFADALRPPDFTDDRFRLDDAWWCAELCRLIYRQEQDEVGATVSPTRDDLLASVGLREVTFFSEAGTQAAIVSQRGDDVARWSALVFRGTHDLRDWLTNTSAVPDRSRVEPVGDALDAVWPVVETAIEQATGPIVYTGHSLGGAMATLAATLRPPDALYTFGSPRVGDATFVDSIAHVAHHRVVNNRDIVPTVPLPQGWPGYRHHGKVHHIMRDSTVVTEATDDEVASHRQANDSMWPATPGEWASIFDLQPARFLADHAPVNYVAHLARASQR